MASSISQATEVLLDALRRIMRPLVRLMIRRGIPFPQATELLREVYVDVAVREFPVPGKRQTDSRVNLLTGVHRKDVKRLRSQRKSRLVAPRKAGLSSLLIARWTNLEEYLDGRGQPRPLPRHATGDDEESFESLVRSVNTDIRPRVVLDEWVRLGVARLDEEDRVSLQADAFVPSESAEQMAYYFGRNVYAHAAAAVHNLSGEGAPFFERSVAYNHLSAKAVRELDALARDCGMRALETVNARALDLQRRDSGTRGATRWFHFGAFVFTEDDADPEESPEEDAGDGSTG